MTTCHLKVVRQHTIPFGHHFPGNNFTFKQDNKPKQIARVVKSYLSQMEDEAPNLRFKHN